MKILIITNYFPPEIGSAAHLFYELGQTWVDQGNQVTVVTPIPRYNIEHLPLEYQNKFFVKETRARINVRRFKIPQLPRKINIFRGIDHFLSAFILFLGGVFTPRHDLIIVYSPPLTLGLTAWLLAKIKKSVVVVNIQDLFPQSAIDLGALKSKLLIDFFHSLEKFIYQKVNFLTVHSKRNKDYLIKAGASPEKVEVVANSVDLEMVKPSSRDNEFSRQYKLNDKFVISFAGVMGYSQDLDIIIKSAERLKEHKEIMFLLVGDGTIKEYGQNLVKRLKLENVQFLPMQPREAYPFVLASSDISLVTLKKEVKTPVVPSKILSIMAAARPLVASLNLDGDAPDLIKEADCGMVVEAENLDDFTEAILKIYNNKNLRTKFAENGRKYAEANFSHKVIANHYQQIFNNLLKAK